MWKRQKLRKADYLQSGFMDLGSGQDKVERLLVEETVRIIGGKDGDYSAVEAARRYPYGKACADFGGKNSGIVPRIYYRALADFDVSKALPRGQDRLGTR